MNLDLVLYRFFDEDGGLLYIGKTVQAWERFSQHRRGSAFFAEAATITLQRGFATELQLAEAEVAAIRTEEPRFNAVRMRGQRPPASRLESPVSARAAELREQLGLVQDADGRWYQPEPLRSSATSRRPRTNHPAR
ncbi:GIY-YIG nuclease family protein [Mycobacterium sp. LTG2003]